MYNKGISLMLLCFYRCCTCCRMCVLFSTFFVAHFVCTRLLLFCIVVVAVVIMCRYPNKSPQMQARTGRNVSKCEKSCLCRIQDDLISFQCTLSLFTFYPRCFGFASIKRIQAHIQFFNVIGLKLFSRLQSKIMFKEIVFSFSILPPLELTWPMN